MDDEALKIPADQGQKRKKVRTKTGCRTCRIRRVKCDEGRPECQKCVSTGRICDGYELLPPVVIYAARKNNRNKQLIPREPGLSNFPSRIGGSCLSSTELQYFSYFSRHTVGQVPGYFRSSLWDSFILQLTHHEPAILHAAVAVGAMHRSSGSSSPSLRTLHQWRPNHHHTFALEQYVKALRRLRDKLDRLKSKHDKAMSNVALVACLLFMCLEMLQGNHGASLQHLRTGLRILAESHSIVPSTRCGEVEKRYYINSQIGKDNPTIEQSLISVFARLDYEATMFDKRAPLLVLQSPYQGGDEIPGVFESIDHAKSQLNKLSSEVFHFRADILRQSQPILQEGKERDWVKEFVTQHVMSRRLVHSRGESILREVQRLQDNLIRWLSAFYSFLVARPWSTTGTTSALALRLLEIQHFYMFFIAQTYSDTTESECDRFIPMFNHIIDMAESVLQMDRNNDEQRGVTFTLEPGILPSLFLITLKCRDSGLRHRALGLLGESYCQEGMWEGALLAKYMKQVIDMEEHLSGYTGGGKLQAEEVPEAARFSDVAIVGSDIMPGWGRLVGGRYVHSTGKIMLRERTFIM